MVLFVDACTVDTYMTKTSFVYAKATVAPIEAQSIPKLKLHAILLDFVFLWLLKKIRMEVANMFKGSESTTVLLWLIQNKNFCLCRQLDAEMLALTTVDEWSLVAYPKLFCGWRNSRPFG